MWEWQLIEEWQFWGIKITIIYLWKIQFREQICAHFSMLNLVFWSRCSIGLWHTLPYFIFLSQTSWPALTVWYSHGHGFKVYYFSLTESEVVPMEPMAEMVSSIIFVYIFELNVLLSSYFDFWFSFSLVKYMQTCNLKVNIHCDICKRKVMQVLQNLHGNTPFLIFYYFILIILIHSSKAFFFFNV